MADRYWVGGTANWDGTAGTKWSATSGGAGGASVPTSADNVFFNASSGSGTVTISTVNANCNNLDFSGFTGTIFSVSNTPGIYIYGNLVVSAGMTWSASSNLAFAATTSGKTITTNGKSVGNSALIFVGSGGGWTLQDALTNTAPIQVGNGTFTTNNYNISCGQFAPAGGTVVLGSSVVTCSSLVIFFGSTLNAGTSTINAGYAQITSGGPYTLYNVTINGSILAFNQFTVATTFNNLSIVPSASYMQVELSANITVNGTFTSSGTGVQARNVVYSNIRGTQRAINAAAVSIQDTDFRDINANGAAVPWALSGQRVGDLGNNSDITFPAAVTRYAVASGNFSNTSVWSATSGGSVGASVPLPQDTAVFDANTGAGTYTFNVPRIGALNASALGARVISLGVDIEVYKSFTLSSALTFTNNNKILSFLGDGTNTINTAGKQLYFTIFAGNYRLNANLSVQTDSYIYGGLFEANNYNLTSGRFSVQNSTTGYTSSPNLTVYMGSGTWTATGTSGWSYTASGTFTLFPETSTIEIAASVGVTYSFAGGGATYNNLLISGSTGAAAISISGNNTFTSITSTKTNAYFLRLPASGTTTVGAWNVNGSSGNIITVESSSSGTRANLTKTGGGFSVSNFISVKDINASPASTFYAVNSTNAGNNVNWTFNFPTSQGNLLAFFT